MSSRETLRKRFLVKKPVEETFLALQKVMPTLGLKKLKTKKIVENSYVLVEYKEGLLQRGEIEANLLAVNAKTELWINWNYPSNEDDESSKDEDDFGEGAEVLLSIVTQVFSGRKSSLNHGQLLEELRLKMNATEIVPSENYNGNQSQENVVLKIRCRACLGVYDEALLKCPSCGLKSN